MNRNLTLRLLLCSALILNVTGCATSSGRPGSAHQARLHQAKQSFHSRTTYLQGIGAGLVLGALAGAVIGGALNGERGMIAGAATGAAAGAIGGGVFAHEKVQQRRAYGQAEGALDAQIQQTANTEHEAQRFNSALAEDLHRAHRDLSEQRSALDDSRSVLASINQEIRQQTANLQQARVSGVSANECSRLRTGIEGLQAERKQLERYIEQIAPGARKVEG